MEQKRLIDLLPPEGIEGVMRELNSEALDLHGRLVAALEPHRDLLLERGVLPEFLAYAIEYAVTSRLKAGGA